MTKTQNTETATKIHAIIREVNGTRHVLDYSTNTYVAEAITQWQLVGRDLRGRRATRLFNDLGDAERYAAAYGIRYAIRRLAQAA